MMRPSAGSSHGGSGNLKYPDLTEARILKALPAIREAIHGPRTAVELSAWHVPGEPVPFETAQAAAYEPFQVGQKWGPLWSTTWFRVSGVVPSAWKGSEVVLLVRLTGHGREGFSAEGLVYRGASPVRALNIHRNEIAITSRAEGGESFLFHIEAAANFAHPGGKAVVGGGMALFTLTQCELACLRREVFDFYFDYKTCADAMTALPPGCKRRADLRERLNSCLNGLDLEDSETVNPARDTLAEVLGRKNGDGVHEVSAIGHAHIDTAWLWPLRETIRKCARTFSTALDYMERYPEYVFGCSQAQQYAWMKAYYPEIYAKIRERIQTRQWEPIGSMWVEPDCNLASGESLIRQILHGKRFFEAEFGYDTRDAWIPDVFGYSASMPQILRGCGIDYFLTQKMSWNQFNKFPHHTFWWEGIDGTRIFTHFPPADSYNAKMTPEELLLNATNFREHGRSHRSLYVYGYGDGGGGPTIDMLEQARRLRNFEGLPKVRQEKVLTFFDQAAADSENLSVWAGELYLELHRGTYTTQARTKQGNRRAEFLLREAEFLDALSAVVAPSRVENAATPPRARHDTTGLEEPDERRYAAALNRAWSLVLLNQFHDIIPGSSIGWVYRDSAADYETVDLLAGSVARGAAEALDIGIDTSAMNTPVRVFNSLSFVRNEVIALPDGALRFVTMPACGYVVIDGSLPGVPAAQPVTVRQEDGRIVLDNGILRLEIGEDGLVKRLWDREAEREVLPKGCDGNVFQLHPDDPIFWDAWDIDIFYREQVRELREVESISVAERDPLRVKVNVERRFGNSRIVQQVVMKAGSRRIDFETEVDWQEDHQLLRVAFPVAVRAPRATYEIQFGHVERPTHYNTSWDLARFEVCAHRWADLSEDGYGVALLNDCKYGYDIHDAVIRLSLLRSPKDPDPTADRGRHSFTYSLLPHRGTFQQAGVIEEAYGLNVPVSVAALHVQKGTQPAMHGFFEISRPGVILDTVKRAVSGNALILRMYEAYGSRGPVTLRTSLPLSRAVFTDLLEKEKTEANAQDGEISFSINPFEIVTLKLECKCPSV